MDINLSWKQSHILPTPEDFIKKSNTPVSSISLVRETRREISDIFAGISDKLLVVVGPCSIHDPASALEYAEKLSQLDCKNLVIVMRAYFEKPRTVLGWKGLIYDPDLDGSCDLTKGLHMSREILLGILSKGITPGTEFLDTILPQYFSDLISWGAIGARTVESQIHRQLASGLSCPIGFKNSSSGDFTVAIDAAIMARSGHAFPGVTQKGEICLVRTNGNPTTHVILRGSYKNGPNFDKIDNVAYQSGCRNFNSKVVIDCSHGNSEKKHENQEHVVNYIIEQIQGGAGKKIGGVMLESHLFEGKQKIGPELHYGVSITDSCLGFEDTVRQLNGLDRAVEFARK